MPTWRFSQVCGVEATCVWVANDNSAHQEYTKSTTFVFIECVIICLYQKDFKKLRNRRREGYSLEEHDVVYIPVPNRRNLCFFPEQLRLSKTYLMIPERSHTTSVDFKGITNYSTKETFRKVAKPNSIWIVPYLTTTVRSMKKQLLVCRIFSSIAKSRRRRH